MCMSGSHDIVSRGSSDVRPLQESIRGCDVFLIQPTCPPVNDSFMELMVMIDACKRASARSITAVIPYYGYARADRKSHGRYGQWDPSRDPGSKMIPRCQYGKANMHHS